MPLFYIFPHSRTHTHIFHTHVGMVCLYAGVYIFLFFSWTQAFLFKDAGTQGRGSQDLTRYQRLKTTPELKDDADSEQHGRFDSVQFTYLAMSQDYYILMAQFYNADLSSYYFNTEKEYERVKNLDSDQLKLWLIEKVLADEIEIVDFQDWED